MYVGVCRDLLSQAVAIGNMSVPNSNEISAKRARTEETVDTPSTVNTDELNVPNYAYPTTESPGDLYGDFSQFTQVLPSGLDQTFDDPWSIPGATDTDPTASLWFNPPSSYECVAPHFLRVLLTSTQFLLGGKSGLHILTRLRLGVNLHLEQI